MKGIDILHKQVTHMIVLLIEEIKMGMGANVNENDKARQKKRMYLLQ